MSDPIDFAKIKKGAVIQHVDGRKLLISGLYLSTDGPVIMAKADPSLSAAENVPLAKIESVIEG